MASEFSSGLFTDTWLRLGFLNVLGPDQWSSPENNRNLDFGLCLGQDKTSNDMTCSGIVPKITGVKKLDIDLELSLSSGPAESDVTSIALASPSPAQSSMEMMQTSSHVAIQLIGEGSTSSKWSRGPLVPPLQGLNTKACVFQESSHVAQTSHAISGANLHTSQRRKSSVRACQFPGCQKGSRGASGRCISHGGGRRCQRAGCPKGVEGKTPFCKAHGGGRRCEYLGCTKSAEGRTNCCIAHGGGRRCTYPEGCAHAARGRSGLCIRHGGGKRCKVENCTKSAEGISGLCIAHGGGRSCQHPDCTKGAQGSTQLCKAHGGGKRCTFPSCSKAAEGTTPLCKGHGGGKRCSYQEGDIVCRKSVHGGTLFCVAHGGGKRCAIPECSKSARGRTSYCVRHGGGKRCNREGCSKSAQGGTDFCKAHGGGKRCSWSQLGHGYGGDRAVPCYKLARGKIGLCAAHGAFVQDMRVRGNGTLSLLLHEPEAKKMKQASMEDHTMIVNNEGSSYCETGFSIIGFKLQPSPLPTMADDKFLTDPTVVTTQGSLPEGRVHGGGLMSMLQRHVGS
ncbi:hypothetical protein Droror1_Dr00009470 [Drosera rotundifolia]